MALCTSCGYELDPAWKFCVHCGETTGVPRRSTNVAAIVGLILGCIGSPLAAVFGIVALVMLKRRPERGRPAAVIAIVLGAVWTVVGIVIVSILIASHSV